jgi:hypothetical protein
MRTGLMVLVVLSACDGGGQAAVDAGPTFEVPVPSYRLGPRSTFGGSFAQAVQPGTIRLPATLASEDLDSWMISSRAGAAIADAQPPRLEGDELVIDFTIQLDTLFEVPAMSRELFTATAGPVVLSTVADPDDSLHFTLGSTALQALALAGVRDDDLPLEEVYATGARPGDEPALDRVVAAVVPVLADALAEEGTTHVDASGMAAPGSTVFAAVDQAIAADGVATPIVHAPSSLVHLGVLEVDPVGGRVALFVGRRPLAHMAVPPGTTRVGFWFLTIALGDDVPIHARQRTPAGLQSRASTIFTVPTTVPAAPPAPTLTIEADGFRACGGTPGSTILFVALGTEIAVGFDARLVPADGGCVTAADPGGVALLGAMQISPEGVVGEPSETLFP